MVVTSSSSTVCVFDGTSDSLRVQSAAPPARIAMIAHVVDDGCRDGNGPM